MSPGNPKSSHNNAGGKARKGVVSGFTPLLWPLEGKIIMCKTEEQSPQDHCGKDPCG